MLRRVEVVGRASRTKRERRLARATGTLRKVDAAEAEPRVPVDEQKEPELLPVSGWGGRRLGAGRRRLHASAAERQAAYRARRRVQEAENPPGGQARM